MDDLLLPPVCLGVQLEPAHDGRSQQRPLVSLLPCKRAATRLRLRRRLRLQRWRRRAMDGQTGGRIPGAHTGRRFALENYHNVSKKLQNR